eukprot:TRINITY_DN4839_c2_g2_i1.p1 TRINITY_DN4839_c2_g2~~TRINITY_DN4839_c2_g2_i1.p1  ORF type:complete len:897 (+),score=410.94 TRINITY_DN4839_c2_g2_i1:67-2757(+)
MSKAQAPQAKNVRTEAAELKDDLQSQSREMQRAALRKIIANMTVGRDVSNLFSDVSRLISSPHIDVKKLVYLYVLATARMQQDKAALLAGNFVKDVKHESPLIRGLAVRTMSAVLSTDHIAAPIRDVLQDKDPYVRRCAATAVAKMFATNKQRTEDGGFIHHLQELLCDSNPTVIAAAVCALNEIRQSSDVDKDILDLNNRSGGMAVNDLLSAVGDANGCNEWGQTYILEGLASYETDSQEKAELICSRVLSKLQHGNAAVVLATVRIIVGYLEKWCKGNQEDTKTYLGKIAPPLVSLVSGRSENEIRYVALRNISLIVNRYPTLLQAQTRVFFVKYNDPIYIKLEKLEILLQLVNHTNVGVILSEFNEYAQEVDVEFVRKAVRAIGITAIKIESAAEECAGVLSQLIKSRVNYVVQECIIVVRDVFRKYPGRYEGLIGLLCESLDTLDEPEAKSAMIWVIGEYAEKIENADELLEDFMESFEDENLEVQLALLTAVVKLFLKRPNDTQELLQRTLQAASASEVPDLRDRGYVYWRLLSIDTQAAAKVVITEAGSSINEEKGSKMDPKIVTTLLEHIGTLASVYLKPPNTFVQDYHGKKLHEYLMEDEEAEDEVVGDSTLPQHQMNQYGDEAPQTPQPQQHADPLAGVFSPDKEVTPYQRGQEVSQQVWCTRQAGHGIELRGRFVVNADGQLCMDINMFNTTNQPITGFVLQLDNNSYGISMAGQLQVQEPMAASGQHDQVIPLSFNPSAGDDKNVPTIRVAMKTSLGLGFGQTTSVLPLLFVPGTGLKKDEFLKVWREITGEEQFAVSGINQQTLDQRLQQAGYCFVAKRSEPSPDMPDAMQDHLYYSCKTITGAVVTLEVAFNSLSPDNAMVSVRTTSKEFIALIKTQIISLSR